MFLFNFQLTFCLLILHIQIITSIDLKIYLDDDFYQYCENVPTSNTNLQECQNKVWHAKQKLLHSISLGTHMDSSIVINDTNSEKCLSKCLDEKYCSSVTIDSSKFGSCHLFTGTMYSPSNSLENVVTYILKCCIPKKTTLETKNLFITYKPEEHCNKESLLEDETKCKTNKVWKVSHVKRFISNLDPLKVTKGRKISDCLNKCLNDPTCPLVTVHANYNNDCYEHKGILSKNDSVYETGWVSYTRVCCDIQSKPDNNSSYGYLWYILAGGVITFILVVAAVILFIRKKLPKKTFQAKGFDYIFAQSQDEKVNVSLMNDLYAPGSPTQSNYEENEQEKDRKPGPEPGPRPGQEPGKEPGQEPGQGPGQGPEPVSEQGHEKKELEQEEILNKEVEQKEEQKPEQRSSQVQEFGQLFKRNYQPTIEEEDEEGSEK